MTGDEGREYDAGVIVVTTQLGKVEMERHGRQARAHLRRDRLQVIERRMHLAVSRRQRPARLRQHRFVAVEFDQPQQHGTDRIIHRHPPQQFADIRLRLALQGIEQQRLLLGIESRSVPRRGFPPTDGPDTYTAGTLFPQSSKKAARAINAASGNRPVVVLANLTGFDGSPESMRKQQLEYGAEIGRAVTNFRGPILFVVVSRYHGGAFVVFSKRLHDDMETAAVSGSFASVIGGAPAAAVVLSRKVSARTEEDPRVVSLRARLGSRTGKALADAHHELADVIQAVRAEKLKEVADEFDSIHDIRRAMRVGSVDHIISPAELRPFMIGALERRLATPGG